MTERHTDVAREVRAALESISRRQEEHNANRQHEIRGLVEVTSDLRERIEEIESRRSQPGRSGVPAEARDHRGRQSEHMKRFESWLRKSNDAARQVALAEFEANALESKSVLVGTPAAGGFAVPEEISRQIEQLELKFSPVRNLVAVRQTMSSDYKELISIGGGTAGWVAETDTRSATATPNLRERAPTHGELYAYPQASEWSLDDVFFDVAGWLADEVARQFAVLEGDAVIRGNGSNKPTGLLNTAPVATADDASPLRAAAALQYVPSPVGSPVAAGLGIDPLINLFYAVNSIYRGFGTWVMNSATAAALRKLKDDNGQYLWQPSTQAGQPDSLLGRPIATWEQMDDATSNNFPIGFGDWSRGYLLADRVGLRILQDPYTTPGFVKFYVRRRVGGCVLNNDAVKFLKFSTT